LVYFLLLVSAFGRANHQSANAKRKLNQLDRHVVPPEAGAHKHFYNIVGLDDAVALFFAKGPG